MRPDPYSIPRRPMATVDAKVVITRPHHAQGPMGSIFEAGRLNLDALHRLFEGAEVVAEGRTEPGTEPKRFFGSWTLALQPTEVGGDTASISGLAQRLADALENDARAWRVVEDKTYRELSRLLGVETSADFECQLRTEPDGSGVRIVVDFECPIIASNDHAIAIN